MDYDIIPDLYRKKEIHTPKVLLVSMEDPQALAEFRREHREWSRAGASASFPAPSTWNIVRWGLYKADGIAFLKKDWGLPMRIPLLWGDEDKRRGDDPLCGNRGCDEKRQ